MPEESPQPNPILTWAKDNQVASIFIGLGVIVILGLVLSAFLGEEPEEVTVEITLPPDSASASTAPSGDTGERDPDRPELPQVDCRILLTDDEIDEALFGPDPSGPRSHFTFSQGETCIHEPDDESGHFIKIEPGDPSDFDPDPRPLAVEGVGDAALWFDNGIDMGALSVGVNVPDASLIYRIHIGRPDMSSEERLAQATELALLALPRFPGTPPGPPEPVVDLCQMIPDEQVDQILAEYRDAHPATREELFVVEDFSDEVDLSEEGEANCRKLILAEIYIESQQGSPVDFVDGASMDGVAAIPVEGLGDEAVWFPEVPFQGGFTAPHERGVLAVRVDDAMLRIAISVPDTPSDEELEIVRSLAAGAIALIPGVGELEPTLVTFDEGPPDLAPQSLYDVVYEGVAVGDWTEGEGLIAALEWMLGGQTDFIENGLPDQSHTSVVNAARAYASTGLPDAAEVEDLLDQILWTAPGLAQSSVAARGQTTGLMVSAVPVAQEESDPLGCPGGADSCVIEVPLDEFEGLDEDKFSVYLFNPSQWGLEGLDSPAVDAFIDAVQKFEELGGMPPTSLALALGESTWTAYDPPSGTCAVNLGENFANADVDDLLFTVARETAHCFIHFDLFLQLYENPNPWLEEGLAVYLGGVVYSLLNVEHEALPGLLAEKELYTSMLQRTSENWIFFEYLHSQSDADAVMNLLRGLPETGDLASSLASVAIIPEVFHELAQAMSDSQVPDIGGGNVPYGPKSWQVILASPKEFDGELSMFATKRYRLEVPSGRYACEVEVTADGAEVSWRQGKPGVPGSWSEDVPETLEGPSVLLVTSVEEGASFSFEASKTGNNPDCEEEDETSDIIGPILELCELICDPSNYYWQSREF